MIGFLDKAPAQAAVRAQPPPLHCSGWSYWRQTSFTLKNGFYIGDDAFDREIHAFFD